MLVAVALLLQAAVLAAFSVALPAVALYLAMATVAADGA